MLESLRWHGKDRVYVGLFPGPTSFQRGSFPILPEPIAPVLTMHAAMLAQRKAKEGQENPRKRSSATMLSF